MSLTGRGKVVLELLDGMVTAPGWIVGVLAQALTVPARSFTPSPDGGFAVLQGATRLFEANQTRGTVVYPYTLSRVAESALVRAGLEIEWKCQRELSRRLASWDPAAGQGASPVERDLLSWCTANHSGLLVHAGASVPGSWIVRLCASYPEARILVVVPTREQVHRWLRRLGARLGSRVQGRETLDWFTPDRVVVTTFRTAQCAQKGDWDLVVLPDAQFLGAHSADLPMAELGVPAVGFLSREVAPSHGELLRILRVCGPDLHRLSHHPSPTSLVLVIGLEPQGQASRGSGLTAGLHRKRELFWHNNPRNEQLVRLARAAERGDQGELFRAGLTPCDALPAGGSRVTLVVECPSHGRALLKRLPEWVLVEAHDRPRSLPGHSIVTLMALEQAKSLDVDVLIHASGEGPLALDRRLRRSGTPTPVLVEVLDDGDALARERTGQRLAWYRARGRNYQVDCRLPGPSASGARSPEDARGRDRNRDRKQR